MRKENDKWYISGHFLFDSTIVHTLKEVDRVNNTTEKMIFLFLFIFVLILFLFNFYFIKKTINSFFDFLTDKTKFGIISIVTIVFGITVLLLTIFVIPPSMDEFLPYHQFARFFFPDSKEHIFREAADDSFDIKIFGLKLPLRAYPYIGYSEGLRYFPFYIISKTYISARVMKLFLILLLLFALWKLTNIPLHLASLIVLFNLPVIFQMLVDTGPVAYQLMISLMAPFLITRSKNIFIAILTGILLYFAFELKTIFFYISFPIAVISFIIIINDFIKESTKEKIKRIIYIVVILIAFAVPTFITKS